ncbi:MAG: cytochrome c biogenesis protein CcsA, partial [Calditrichaceae bacterium]
MIIGVTATAITFIALVLSITSYYLHYKYSEESLLSLARISFYVSVGLIFFQAILLMWGIINHHFEWIYVYSYSSKDLPLYYLISTFWAGQEGTFLLWTILGSIYGLIIIKNRIKDESLVMSFLLLVQAFIVMILVKRNPFTYIWEANPVGFGPGMIPLDGAGLNPLLQNPWMTIHPPILFSGYSSTMILFAFAMAALVKRNYNDWVKNVFPYALFVGLILGTGIIMGGYWAYTTLGWGGYWA